VKEGRSTQRAKAEPREGCGGGDDDDGRAGRRRRSARGDLVRQDSCPGAWVWCEEEGAWGLGVANYHSTHPRLKLIKLIIFGRHQDAPPTTVKEILSLLAILDYKWYSNIIKIAS